MFRHTILIIWIAVLSAAGLYAEEQDTLTTKTSNTYSIKNELTEWSIYSSIYAAGYIFQKHEPFFDEPLIGGEADKKYKKDTVPSLWIQLWMGGVYGYIAFTPNNEGLLNDVAYNNIKGFFESVAYSYFITSFTKVTVGRKRPSFDNYPESEKDDSGRKSFISGHSSLSFVIATYSSLFVYEYTGDNSRPVDIAIKSTVITASFCAAVFTAWSRVDDNRHHMSDVIAGSAVGVVSGVAGYMHQNRWNLLSCTEDNLSLLPIFTGDEAYLAVIKKI